MTSGMTIVERVVDPNGPGGCNGPPIEAGVFRVTRLYDDRPAVTRTFGEPRADLLDVDWDALSDEQIMTI
jgi:hypothetical protein